MDMSRSISRLRRKLRWITAEGWNFAETNFQRLKCTFSQPINWAKEILFYKHTMIIVVHSKTHSNNAMEFRFHELDWNIRVHVDDVSKRYLLNNIRVQPLHDFHNCFIAQLPILAVVDQFKKWNISFCIPLFLFSWINYLVLSNKHFLKWLFPYTYSLLGIMFGDHIYLILRFSLIVLMLWWNEMNSRFATSLNEINEFYLIPTNY